ncbi:MAG TPA: DUF2207 domain-containing protein [Caldisericia bacterium]|nr:DUF2207 domain-containing protein [Caldisericia bacterium]HPB33493.1 DUF2207 domain-containing protein [Caldisericia bacterium]HQL66546.1 DUF2207 domain-containing protein [Caldisericia bacterium]HQO99258.1 DUF2207 domain-containing protein [Caldisericia bacterium]
MRKRFFLMILLPILMISINIQNLSAKDYSIPNVKIDVTLNKDGSAYFVEERSYSFQGTFSFGYYDLPKTGYESLEEFLVYEGDTLYKYEQTKNINTYYIEDTGNNYRVNFFYSATDETKTFKFIYKLKGVTKVYEDYGEFCWKLQGVGWDKKIGVFESTIRLLTPVPMDNYYVWTHGPLWGNIEKVDDKTIYLKVDDVPEYTFVEARILIPSNYFTEAKKLSGNIKDNVINEETKLARDSNVKRVLTSILFWLPIVIFALLLFYIFYLYNKYGKEYKVPKEYDYIREPPSDIKPAVLGHLLTFGSFNDTFLKATIMDLIHRGIISVEKDPNSKNDYIFTLNKKEEELQAFEKILVDKILFDTSDSFTVKELNKKIKKNQEHYYYIFEDFKNEIKEEAKKYDFFDKKSEGKSNFAMGLGCFIPIAAIILTVITRNLLFLLWLILVPIYLIVGSAALKRRSYKGKEEFDKWMALKRFLNDFSNLKEYGPKSVVIWEKYLIYGTILGVAKTVLKALKIVFPQIEDIENGRLIPIATGFSFANFDQSFNSLNNAISRAVSATSSAYKTSRSSWSSGGGGGGGFSGGGGGGGGGSGGGMG